jgi:hypothetical protein
MTDQEYERFDLDDDRGSSCPECGEPMQSDEDGDGVMTMSHEFCENCGTKDYGDAVNLTNLLLTQQAVGGEK